MKKSLLGIFLIAMIGWIYCSGWCAEEFISPIKSHGKPLIRKDARGDGHFGAPRRGGRSHKGIDISAPLNTKVIASKSGIAKVGFVKNGMGKYVIIRHSDGSATLYGHLSRIIIKNNKRVRQGKAIGYVGKTGNAKYKGIQPHLHFEIRQKGKCVDPLLFID
ncbi:MAG: M23 family metallopeptidase [Candidatus Omnitrophica bacterium]|nr:M23 family metallopeptidase [Candidatus Omnitrophota bacterium]MBU4488864.1 M23 family metallopeptidase [Candidatus Omnitrophota bacterium]MCG2705662.1 M23 family metallopeptidase [Candidatus Omnitrophota bacterium]